MKEANKISLEDVIRRGRMNFEDSYARALRFSDRLMEVKNSLAVGDIVKLHTNRVYIHEAIKEVIIRKWRITEMHERFCICKPILKDGTLGAQESFTWFELWEQLKDKSTGILKCS